MMRQLRRLFGIDLRNLALFRIGLGAILLIDLAIRFQDLQAHYTDAGVLPRESASDYYASTWRWSLHQLSGESLSGRHSDRPPGSPRHWPSTTTSLVMRSKSGTVRQVDAQHKLEKLGLYAAIEF